MREVSASIAGTDPGSSPPRTTVASLADVTLRRVLVVQLTMTEQRYRAVNRDEGRPGWRIPRLPPVQVSGPRQPREWRVGFARQLQCLGGEPLAGGRVHHAPQRVEMLLGVAGHVPGVVDGVVPGTCAAGVVTGA